MIRIYLTNEGVEGYNEGCSCCSSTEKATSEDIQKLIDNMDIKIKKLKELKTLVDKYGDDNLASWMSQYEKINYFITQLEASDRYKENNNIKGTFYKDSYDNRKAIVEQLKIAEKIYSNVPDRFKKYISEK